MSHRHRKGKRSPPSCKVTTVAPPPMLSRVHGRPAAGPTLALAEARAATPFGKLAVYRRR